MIYFILPAYNEDKNIKLLLNDISNFYKKKKISFYIIVVNDGSSDETYKSIKLIKKRIFCKLALINHKKKHGLMSDIKNWIQSRFKNFKTR